MRRISVLLLTVLFILALPAVALAAYTDANDSIPTTPFAQPYTAPMDNNGDDSDNGEGNANRTGGDTGNEQISADVDTYVYDIIKSGDMRMNDFTTSGNQRTHGEYQNNTNSCASCHQTHTGAAKDLLFKGSDWGAATNGVYNTCTACHDGTLGFYNVFTSSTAGTFGGSAEGNASVHLATGTQVTIGLAPGADGTTAGTWGDQFDCAACHAPHGSYSDRLLHYSPNGMANVSIDDGGNKLANQEIEDVLPSVSDAVNYVVYRTTAGAVGITTENSTTPLIVVMKKNADNTAWEMDTTPWVAGNEHVPNEFGAPLVLSYTQFFQAISPNDITSELDIRYGWAYAKSTNNANVADVVSADIARAYVVDLSDKETINGVEVNMEPEQIGDFGGIKITEIDTDIYDEKGHGIAISRYCGACHTKYMTHSGGGSDWIYRHSTDKDRFSCLKCHFAHGSDVTIMKDANDNTVESLVESGTVSEANATAYMLDKNPSSALKRYTNMAVCWKCHSGVEGKSSKLMNNTYYWDNYDTNPRGGAASENNWTNNDWE